MSNNKQDKPGGTSAKKAKTPRRKERERGSIKSLSDSTWLRPETKRWYIILSLSIIISILLFPSILAPPKIYSLGDIAERDIKASSEFLIENKELTEKKRQEAIKTVNPVYDFDPLALNLNTRIREAFKEGRNYLAEVQAKSNALGHSIEPQKGDPEDKQLNIDIIKSRFFEILDISPDDNIFKLLLDEKFPLEAEIEIIELLNPITKEGLVGNKTMLLSYSGKGIVLHNIHSQEETPITKLDQFYDLSSATALIRKESKGLTKSLPSPKLREAVTGLAIALLSPNLTFNKRETELRKDLASQSVSPFYFKVKQGEMIIREGERVTPEHLIKISEQNKFSRGAERFERVPAMAILIGFLLASVYLAGLLKSRSSIGETRDLLFIAITLLTIFLIVMISVIVSEEIARGSKYVKYLSPRVLLFAVPVASGAMLVSVFIGRGAAATFSLMASVLACLVSGRQIDFFIYYFISSLVGSAGADKFRERGAFIKTGLKVGVSNIAMALSIGALHGSLFTLETPIAITTAFFGGILVGVIASGLLPLVEMSFGYTSDIKLLELASLDQPLLQELMVQSQGTYHHSVIVSNMVEATAKSINANPLLARVAAFYHDIGKVTKPLYFVENQTDRENKHEKLAPSMSSLILISHVKDGVELAKKHKLGKEIIDIIEQHHGTSLISFFYEKAKEQADKKEGKSIQIKEEDFRYPGPKPQTKEAGLVMLADAVEAASKTLVNPTSARIQGMVQKIINKMFSDGQLDECELTLKDLHNIAKSFNKTLSGIFHHRIEYPEPAAKESGPKGKKSENGSTDQVSPKDSVAKKAKGQEEPAESLKRLGI
ncbi:HD family phosphohydrolase [Thermodesulfobacteriota bacterium]